MNREQELEASLHEAWAELERKQSYIQNAFDTAEELRQEVEALKASGHSLPDQDALKGAWEELERKQQFLENSFAEIRLRDETIEALRAQLGATDPGAQIQHTHLSADATAALAQAWQDLEARDAIIEELKAQVEANEGLLQASEARIEWLLHEKQNPDQCSRDE